MLHVTITNITNYSSRSPVAKSHHSHQRPVSCLARRRTTQAPPIKQLTSSLRFPPSGSVSFVDTFSKVPGCDKLNFVRSLQKLDAYSTHDNWTAESVSSCPCIGQGSLRRFQLNLARTALTPTLYEWRSDSGIRLHLAPVPPPSRSSSKLRTTWSATNSCSENRGRTTPVECPSFSVDTEGDRSGWHGL